jgi:hypothetical protein
VTDDSPASGTQRIGRTGRYRETGVYLEWTVIGGVILTCAGWLVARMETNKAERVDADKALQVQISDTKVDVTRLQEKQSHTSEQLQRIDAKLDKLLDRLGVSKP